MQELWFLCSARHLMLTDIYMQLLEDILNRFQVTEQTWLCDGQSSKGNNSKSIMQGLWFLHSAHHLMLIDIYMKFHEDSLNVFQVIEGTRFCDRQMDRQMPWEKQYVYLS